MGTLTPEKMPRLSESEAKTAFYARWMERLFWLGLAAPAIAFPAIGFAYDFGQLDNLGVAGMALMLGCMVVGLGGSLYCGIRGDCLD